MVVIQKEKCTGCGSCVTVCHEQCMSLQAGTVVIDYSTCSTCTQCIAICPQRALSWDGVQPHEYDRTLLPAAAQLDELFKERRTSRDFTDDPVDRVFIEKILQYGAYAPTHNFSLRWIAIDDPNIIQLFDKAAFRFSKNIYRLLFRPRMMRALVRLAPLPQREEYRKAKSKLETTVARGNGFRCQPPVLVCVIGDKRIPLTLESAQYALYNACLYAQVKGLECRNLVGNQMIFNRSRVIRHRLGVKRHERIFAIAGLGYPSVTFRNTVPGKRMRVQWNGSAEIKGDLKNVRNWSAWARGSVRH